MAGLGRFTIYTPQDISKDCHHRASPLSMLGSAAPRANHSLYSGPYLGWSGKESRWKTEGQASRTQAKGSGQVRNYPAEGTGGSAMSAEARFRLTLHCQTRFTHRTTFSGKIVRTFKTDRNYTPQGLLRQRSVPCAGHVPTRPPVLGFCFLDCLFVCL